MAAGWYYLIIFVVALIVGYVLAPKPKNRKPPALEDFEVPTAEDGREVIDGGGTFWIDDYNVLYYGNLRTSPIKRSSGKK